MSMIPCSERCLYQKEGYCNCDQEGMVPPSGVSQSSGCLYYTELFPQTPTLLLPQDLEGLQDV